MNWKGITALGVLLFGLLLCGITFNLAVLWIPAALGGVGLCTYGLIQAAKKERLRQVLARGQAPAQPVTASPAPPSVQPVEVTPIAQAVSKPTADIANFTAYQSAVKNNLIQQVTDAFVANKISIEKAQETKDRLLALPPANNREELLFQLQTVAQTSQIVRDAIGGDTPISKAEEKEVVPVSGGAIIGRDLDTGQEISISQAARLQGLYIIGVNGTGKSTFISNLIAKDMKAGLGLCLLDPHGDLTKSVLARVPDDRVKDVILLDLMDSSYPFGLNIFECPNPSDLEQVALTASFVMHVFEKVWNVGTETPQLAQVLRNVTFTLIQNEGTTLAELPLLLQDENVRSKLIANVANPQVKLFWQMYNKLRTADQLERTSSTLNKADAFLTQPIIANIVGQSRTTLDFRKIMDEGKILLVQLTPQLEDLSRLVGAVIIGQLLMAAMSRKDKPEEARKQFNLYADEYQRFATEDFATLLSEARKFGVATTIAHQYLEQLDEKNRGASVNAANLVVFRVSGQDAAELAKEFKATDVEKLEYRTEPIRNPARDVLWQLMRKGHRNKTVTDFVNIWLAPAQERWNNRENLIQFKDRQSMYAPDEFLKRTDFPDAMTRLNEYLFECQAQKGYEFDLDPRMVYTLMYMNVISEGIDKLVEFNPFGSSAAYISGMATQPPSKFRSSPEFDTLCKWDITQEQINQIRGYVCGNNKKKQENYDLCINFIKQLYGVMRILSEDPILVDTGQYREVRDVPRPIADVRNEIASRLANCENFIARVKTLEWQGTVKTLPSSGGITGKYLSIRKMNVLEQSRAGYCLPRSIVEQQIAERQAALMQEPEIEPKSRREPEEGTEWQPSRRHKEPPKN